MEIVPCLIALARSASEGRAGLVRALGEALAVLAPGEQGELLVEGGPRAELQPGSHGLVVPELLRLAGERGFLRLDERAEAAGLPETLAMMELRGLASLLAVGTAAEGGPKGALVLASSAPWAFCAARPTLLRPLAAMAAIALEQASEAPGKSNSKR